MRRASDCGLETRRLLGGLQAQVEISKVSTRVWIWTCLGLDWILRDLVAFLVVSW